MSDPIPQRAASKTALGVAKHRAIHQILDGEPKILEDPIAIRMLSADVHQRLLANPDLARETQSMRLRSHVVLRSRYAEERMAEAAQRSVQQCVILGAGFDTFAYRQPDWAQRLRLFEVDHQATQDEKRQRLQAAGIPIPENLEFVAIDFEADSLSDGLKTSTLDLAQPTFFSCLGVLVYLTRAAMEAVFQFVASFPAGSEIVFTFSSSDAVSSSLADRVSTLGEPWQTHLEPETLRQDLTAIGFSELSFLSLEDAKRRYFQDRSDGLPVPSRSRIAAAIVGSQGM